MHEYSTSPPSNSLISDAKPRRSIAPEDVHRVLGQHMLVDGFDFVVDLRRSHGSRLVDAKTGREYIDFFTFFASMPIGFGHPRMQDADFREELLRAALTKPSSSDAYTVEMAEFVDAFSRIGMPRSLPHLFLIEGGALAVENALKTAFDWKVRRNRRRGVAGELGTRVMHFTGAFHGRSGYTMSMTNTDPTKIAHYPKFPEWPRIPAPVLEFPLTDERIVHVIEREREAELAIERAFLTYRNDIAAVVIEPIQAEGGDRHFRPEFLQKLRTYADENDALLIFDEVQTGVGLTGKFWAHEHFVRPDILSFGKKMQVCGILAGNRIDEIEENVFRMPSRINSTWGGNLVDMIRSRRYLEIIEEENLVGRAADTGAHLLAELEVLAEEYPAVVSNPRGRGLFCAFDLPNADHRDTVRRTALERGLIVIGCGPRSIRFRPALDIPLEDLDAGLAILRNIIQHVHS